MAGKSRKGRARKPPPIFIVSGGSGASGQQIVETVLAQFPEIQVPVIKMTHVRQKKQIEGVVKKALKTSATVVHTLVDSDLRTTLIKSGQEQGILTIDLMGTLMDRLSEVLGQKPEGKPGLYRQLRRDYFKRIEAIEFTVAHDDGQKPQDLPLADIVIIGVSRCGKTPLSMYLAVQGLKVANIPIIKGFPLPDELSKVDSRRVIGLTIEHEHLMIHRKKRHERMGVTGHSTYEDPSAVFEELEAARKVYHKGRFRSITVSNKPIETIADEIIEHITAVSKKDLVN